MQIVGIALKDYGGSGMKVTYNRYRKFNASYATKISGDENYDLPLPAHIRAEIKGLKYYMLYLMKLWNDDWDKYLTDDLSSLKPESELEKMDNYNEMEYLEAADIFKNARFEGYKLEKGGFVLWGDHEIIEGKVVKIKLPVIVEDDDFTLYHDCLDLIQKINEMVVSYFSKPELTIEDVKEVLKLSAGEQMKQKIDEMDDDESYQQIISKLEAKGGIVMIEAGSELEKEIEKDSSEVSIASTKTLKEGEIEKHEEISSETKEDETKEDEKSDDLSDTNDSEDWENNDSDDDDLGDGSSGDSDDGDNEDF